MQDINTDVIEAFMLRVRGAAQARSKEIRLPIAEANEIVVAMAQLLGRNNALLEKLVKVTERALANAPTEVEMDGGGF